MMIGDGMVLLIIVQNDDDYDARGYGSLVMSRRYAIIDVLRRHFSLIFSNSYMALPFGTQAL